MKKKEMKEKKEKKEKKKKKKVQRLQLLAFATLRFLYTYKFGCSRNPAPQTTLK